MIDFKKKNWEESYGRGENFIYYPKEEAVKFINRYIKKKISSSEFRDVLNMDGEQIKGLDFGCGIGRITILMHEFDIDGYGIDISEVAISEAKNLSKFFNYGLDKNFFVYDGLKVPFDDNYFDFTISEAVFDSMPFELAKQLIKEVDRVTKKYFYLSLIAAESTQIFKNSNLEESFNGELEVNETHEKGTIQCFYDFDKIEKLIEKTSFNIKWCEQHIQKNYIQDYMHSRYYVVLEK